jgi:DNA-binding CsgD family transcriptional regulator
MLAEDTSAHEPDSSACLIATFFGEKDPWRIAPNSDQPSNPSDEPSERGTPMDALPGPKELMAAGLTSTEVELLPLLVQHLSFDEISKLLRLPRSTVDSQALSIYRKLGVSSLSDMIDGGPNLRDS